jgi:cytoskeletal protein CcmA (bactofilin family)
MNTKFKMMAFFLLFTLLFLPTGSVHAQGPGPDNGRVIFGSNITIESGDTFEGDLVVFGGNVTVEEDATLNGDLVVIGGTVECNGEVQGDVVIVGGQAHLEDMAVVSGDVVLVGGQIEQAEGAVIEGDLVNNVAPQIDMPNGKIPPIVPIVPDVPPMPPVPDVPSLPGIVNNNFNPFFSFGRVFASSLLVAFLGILAVLFFQQRLDKVSQAVVVQPLMTMSIGLLTVVALLLATVTLILIPFVLLSLIPLGLAWLFGVIAVGQEIGERFAKAIHKDWAPVLTTALGTFILMFVVGSIQALNELTWLVGCFTWIIPVFIGFLGIGAVVITRFGAKPVQVPMGTVYTPPASPGEIPPAS